MKILSGWSKEEQEELEWQKNSWNDLDDVIDTLYVENSPNGYLKDKYMDSEIPEQVLFDIVDYWRGDAKFPENKYVVHDSVTDQYMCFSRLDECLRWGQLQSGRPEKKN